MKSVFLEAGGRLNDAFGSEAAVDLISEAVERRWQQVHSAGTDTKCRFTLEPETGVDLGKKWH
jgi:putative ATP-dependent endonuclease of OLD family